jgi:hypothetical protein
MDFLCRLYENIGLRCFGDAFVDNVDCTFNTLNYLSAIMGEGSLFSVMRELVRVKFCLDCRFHSRSGQTKDQATVYVPSPYHKMQN